MLGFLHKHDGEATQMNIIQSLFQSTAEPPMPPHVGEVFWLKWSSPSEKP